MRWPDLAGERGLAADPADAGPARRLGARADRLIGRLADRLAERLDALPGSHPSSPDYGRPEPAGGAGSAAVETTGDGQELTVGQESADPAVQADTGLAGAWLTGAGLADGGPGDGGRGEAGPGSPDELAGLVSPGAGDQAQPDTGRRWPGPVGLPRERGEPYRPWFTAGESAEPWFTADPGSPG